MEWKGNKFVSSKGDKKGKDNKTREDKSQKLSITEIHSKIHIFEPPEVTPKITKTLDLATYIHTIAGHPFSAESIATMQQVVSAIAALIAQAGVSTST